MTPLIISMCSKVLLIMIAEALIAILLVLIPVFILWTRELILILVNLLHFYLILLKISILK